ncbi:hypothetical protein MLD38_014305 [Melastoma candidum]|uniref:Uncharacterized protein n=1 Tax=Melastoma candidum TaxID=119954 RepID=A0ACB9RBZ0_9MYRT|nr:hypothetical protein MLD38_014305 [Melastoma candidum]
MSSLFRAMIETAPDAEQMISMLLKLVDMKRTIEIGVFTGYSLLLAALTIPDDSKLWIAMHTRWGLPVVNKAGVKHKINSIQSEALPILDRLLEDEKNEGTFDFCVRGRGQGRLLERREADETVKVVPSGGRLSSPIGFQEG